MRLRPHPTNPDDVLKVTVEFPPPDHDITRHVATICEAIASAPRETGMLVTRVSTRYEAGVVEVEAVVPEGREPDDVRAALLAAIPQGVHP